jgi:co-chaperonin GroES (HSP10)
MLVNIVNHEEDPRQSIINRLPDLTNFEVFTNRVLLAAYIRPEKTKGGIIINTSEDQYQGKAFLVLKTGPLAFENDDRYNFGGQSVKVGDWVMLRNSDGLSMGIIENGATNNTQYVRCRIVQDVQIQAVIPHPDFVW